MRRLKQKSYKKNNVVLITGRKGILDDLCILGLVVLENSQGSSCPIKGDVHTLVQDILLQYIQRWGQLLLIVRRFFESVTKNLRALLLKTLVFLDALKVLAGAT
jgi:hypothetical protein